MDARNRFETQIVGALPAIVHYFGRLELAATIDEIVHWQGDIAPGHARRGPGRQPTPPTQGPLPCRGVGRICRPDRLLWPDRRATQRRPSRPRPGAARRACPGHPVRLGPQGDRAVRARRHPGPLRPHQRRVVRRLRRRDGRGPAIAARPASGRTKSGRKHVKQVQLGLDVSGDGGVPVGHLPLDGNAGEVTSHLDNLKLLARTLPKGKLLYIADTKLDAPKNLLAIAARKGQFLCGGVLLPQLQERYLGLRGELKPVDYHPESQAKRPAEERDRYEAVEVA